MWWDARIDDKDRCNSFKYEIWPVIGDSTIQALVNNAGSTLEITLPPHEENGVGTYFNRAVVSSQAFSRLMKAMNVDPHAKPSDADELTLRTWLANDLEKVVPGFLAKSNEVVGAIYHLTDKIWIIPALSNFSKNKLAAMVYDAKVSKDNNGDIIPSPNKPVVEELGVQVKFFPRNKTSIMHNKFIVDGQSLMENSSSPSRLVCGSANYTTEGITSQGNLMHTFDSPALAALYHDRFKLIKDNPTLSATQKDNSGWSNTVTVGDAGIRVFYSPEPGKQSESMETIVQAIHNSQSSVCFCLFTPTDKDLRDACFAAGDNGKMMFGLVNHVSEPKEGENEDTDGMRADKLAALELYHRSRDNKDVIGAEYFNPKTTPEGFEPEVLLFPGEKSPGYSPVIIHHKFIIIDAETNNPIIYTGSANMSNNSEHHNDENLLEIRGSKRLAAIYLAEFLRLYEHYRARAYYISHVNSGGANEAYKLAKDSSWCSKYFKPGTPECKSRVDMVQQ
jgi:phosphatidylserine/phosphatidylglycerophosphate/cardiolipin synthase-like enzyme